MSASPPLFEPGASLARIAGRGGGYMVDTRGPYGCRTYNFASAGEAAEFAIVMRDEGGWLLRFRPGAEVVRALVEEIDAEAGK